MMGSPDKKPKGIKPGSRYIVLFEDQAWSGAKRVRLDPCGILPFTQANVEELQRGIEKDYASRHSMN